MFEISTILDSKIHGLPIAFYLLIKKASIFKAPCALSQADIP